MKTVYKCMFVLLPLLSVNSLSAEENRQYFKNGILFHPVSLVGLGFDIIEFELDYFHSDNKGNQLFIQPKYLNQKGSLFDSDDKVSGKWYSAAAGYRKAFIPHSILTPTAQAVVKAGYCDYQIKSSAADSTPLQFSGGFLAPIISGGGLLQRNHFTASCDLGAGYSIVHPERGGIVVEANLAVGFAF